MAAKKKNPILTAAQTAALAQYGPQLEQAAALQASRMSQHLDTNRQIKAAGQIISQGAQTAGAGLADLLARAHATQVPGPDTSEAAIVAQNLGLTSQSALANLANTRARAAEGSAYQLGQEQKSYLSDLDSLHAQRNQLSSQYGTSVADYYNKALQAANDQQFKADQGTANRNTQLEVAGVNPKTGGLTAAAQAKLDAKTNADAATAAAKAKEKADAAAAKKWLPQADQNAAVSNIKTVAALIKRELGQPAPPDTKDPNTHKIIPGGIQLPDGKVIPPGQPLTSGDIRQLLTTKGNPLGQAYDNDTINAAFDIAQNAGLSPTNVNALHTAGVKVHGRLPTIASMPKKKKQAPTIPGLNLPLNL